MDNRPIALICNYYILNYGSALQSFALFQAIKREGKKVEIIRHEDHSTRAQKLRNFLYEGKKKVFSHNLLLKIERKCAAKKDRGYGEAMQTRKELFERFFADRAVFSPAYADVSDIAEKSSQYRLFLLGSDQLWGPSDLLRGYHTLEWLPKDVCRKSYATSFGVSQLPRYAQKIVAEFVPHFKQLSTREESGAKIIRDICNREIEVVVDPTLLLSRSEWEEAIPYKEIVKQKYIFSYLLGDNLEYRRKVKEFAHNLGCKLVAIENPEFYELPVEKYADLYVQAGPEEFVNLIRNAEFVVGDSFHMSIFSILFQKEFIVFNRYKEGDANSRNTRVKNLLGRLDLQSRYIDNEKVDLKEFYGKAIDYTHVNDLLNTWRRSSMDYLKKCILEG